MDGGLQTQRYFNISSPSGRGDKKSISKINKRNTDATENSITETTDLLPKQNDLLLQKNGSKNTVMKSLAENQQHAIYFIYFIFI